MKTTRASRSSVTLRPTRRLHLTLLTVVALSSLIFTLRGSITLELFLFAVISLMPLVLTSYSVVRSLVPIDRILQVRFEEPLLCLVGDSVVVDVVVERDISTFARIRSVKLLSDKGVWLSAYSTIGGKDHVVVKCHVTGYVGAHKIMGILFVVSDLMKLFNLHVELLLESPIGVYIAPRRVVGAFSVERLLSKYAVLEAPATRRKGMGLDVLWIREYVEGDDFRKIAWKATAKTSRLMVKEFEAKTYKSILIVISIHDGFFYGDPPPLDVLAKMVLDLVYSGVERGLRVKIGVATESGIKVSPVLSSLRVEDVYRIFSLIEWPMEIKPHQPYSASNRIIPWFTKVLAKDFCREPCIIALFVDPIDELDVYNINRLQREIRVMRHKLKVYITMPAVLRFVYSSKPDFRDLTLIYRSNLLKLFYEFY